MKIRTRFLVEPCQVSFLCVGVLISFILSIKNSRGYFAAVVIVQALAAIHELRSERVSEGGSHFFNVAMLDALVALRDTSLYTEQKCTLHYVKMFSIHLTPNL